MLKDATPFMEARVPLWVMPSTATTRLIAVIGYIEFTATHPLRPACPTLRKWPTLNMDGQSSFSKINQWQAWLNSPLRLSMSKKFEFVSLLQLRIILILHDMA